MRGGWFLGLSLVGCLLVAGCGDSCKAVRRAPAENGRLVMAVSLGASSYVYRDKATGEICGTEVDYARAAAERLGLKLEILPTGFPELILAVKLGRADIAASSVTITPARAFDVDFTESYASGGSVFLYRTGETRPTAALGNAIRIGTQETSSCQFFLSDHGIDSLLYPKYEDALADFEKGLLDAVFFDAEPIRLAVEKSGGKYAMTPYFTRERYGIAVRKDYPELLAVLNEVIRARKEEK